MIIKKVCFLSIIAIGCIVSCHKMPACYVNPMVGTETLWDSTELGFIPTRRTWGAETFPGSSLPNAMVQVSPITMFRSGSGYQYEDTLILGFTHTNKGHWNLCNIPILPYCGNISIDDYASPFSHETEVAKPAYYKVRLERFGVTAELTSTLRTAYHKYSFDNTNDISLMINLPRSNEQVLDWSLEKTGSCSLQGYQNTKKNKVFFYLETNQEIISVDSLVKDFGKNIGDSPYAAGASNNQRRYTRPIPIIKFKGDCNTLEVRIGISFVSQKGAKENLNSEIGSKSFNDIVDEGNVIWNNLLSKVKISGCSQKEKESFYSTLYKSFLWPALRSDVDSLHRDVNGIIVKSDYSYYTIPSFWDDYRNKLILLALLRPEVTSDVISTCIEIGQNTGYLPTFFHGDHASVFITGSFLRGIDKFDVKEAYRLMLKNASRDSEARPYINEYIDNGYVSENDLHNVQIHTDAKASVTKTLEYSYDDYANALMAEALGDISTSNIMMARSKNYKNVFDSKTGFMRGRVDDNNWVTDFDPCFPYYHFMYREATAWMSSFFVPHDIDGLIALYGGTDKLESKLDSLFTIPWKGYEAHNLSTFIGQYCHGNQPDHGYPFIYSLLGKPEKTQKIIDTILSDFYCMGSNHLAYAGMDDAGEMSSWYVLTSLGIYTYSPADPQYLVTVPLFKKSKIKIGDKNVIIRKHGHSRELDHFRTNGTIINSPFINHSDLIKGGLDIYTK